MSAALTAALTAAATPIALGWSAWLVATVAGARRPRGAVENGQEARIAVLIPAHNEIEALPAAVESLRTGGGEEIFCPIVVVADHCTDHTADLARELGCTVLERIDGPPGKPGALRLAMDYITDEFSDIDALLILDADCEVTPNTAATLAGGLADGAQVMQCPYELIGSDEDLSQMTEWSVALRNVIRPRGWGRLGVPSQLFGTGMCFREDVLEKIHFSDHLVEDTLMSWSLLEQGIRVRFMQHAGVLSPVPPDEVALTSQRQRWEGGQLRLLKALPRRLARLAGRRDLRGLAAALDWSAPPMTTAAAVQAAIGVVGLAAVVAGLAGPVVLIPLGIGAVALALYLFVGIAALAGPVAPLRLIAAAPRFLKWKLAVNSKIVSDDSGTWQRTPRKANEGGGN